jgi:hypothetical protein
MAVSRLPETQLARNSTCHILADYLASIGAIAGSASRLDNLIIEAGDFCSSNLFIAASSVKCGR